MTAELPRVETVPGQLAIAAHIDAPHDVVLDVDVADLVGRAHFERFCRSTGSPARWDDMPPAGRPDWIRPVAHLIAPFTAVLQRAAAERRRRAQWAVHAPDRTMAGNETVPPAAWCRAGMGDWECSRPKGHQGTVHVAGNGVLVMAAWSAL